MIIIREIASYKLKYQQTGKAKKNGSSYQRQLMKPHVASVSRPVAHDFTREQSAEESLCSEPSDEFF